MASDCSVESQPTTGRVLLYLALFIFLIYGNSLKAGWHLDDYPNILKNPNVQLEHLDPPALCRVVHMPFSSGERISRPLAMLSFAVNWYLHRSDVVGYHFVNISIHFLTTVILYLTILLLLERSPNLKGRDSGSLKMIALLATLLWAANPIQTQAITYIVQRMAIMAAMFYILALYCYVRGRTCPADSRRWLWWVAAAAAFLAGLASKENAALLPFAVILVEVVFFQDISLPEVRRRWLMIAGVVALIFLIGGSLLFLNGDLSRILKGYDKRTFTITERLLTQPRVLWLYIGLLIYPVPSRLTLEYDLTLSTSLWQPWTTLPAVAGLILLVALGLFLIRRQPLVSFGILFFLLNHAIESSFIPLELIFEHRNYLPSMFFFLPIAAAFKGLLDVYQARNRAMHAIIAGFGILVIIGWGMGTYIRNMAWATEESLWSDAMAKAPQSYRALHGLAWGYYERNGQLEEAYRLYQKGSKLKTHYKAQAALPLNNMANIQYMQGDYDAAVQLWQKALTFAPDYPDYLYRYALALMKAGDLTNSMRYANRLIDMGMHRSDAESLKGRLLLLEGKPEKALTILRQVYRRNPMHPISAYSLGLTLAALGKYTQSEILLKRTLGLKRDDLKSVVWLARINFLMGDEADFHRYAGMLAKDFNLQRIQSTLLKDRPGVVLNSSKRSLADKALLDWLKVRYLSTALSVETDGKP